MADWFDESFFLISKADALNARQIGGKTDWNAETAKQAIVAAGQTPEENYIKYSAFEIDVDANRNFNTRKYYQDKATQLNTNHTGGRTDWTAAQVAEAFQGSNLDPVDHYLLYGKKEGLTPKASSNADAFSSAASDPIIGALTYGSTTLNDNPGPIIYYAFMQSPSDDVLSFDPVNFAAMDQAERNSVATALGDCAKITGLTFVQTTDASAANILFGTANLDPGVAGEAYYPSSYNGKVVSEVFIDNDQYHTYNPSTDSWYQVVIHEIGHAVGLKHPFEGSITLPSSLDTMENTIMSYTYTPGTTQEYIAKYNHYQEYDVLALQYIYGTDGVDGKQGLGSSFA
ncbi:peptidase M10A and M12B matrixin and adamalysin (plasmid) [Solidesulfovibrio carbinoliphilus subsp. oakridgensis]|uniref:Peptidase M10A and M12B matrixin and adamalysin n=1 Tax=Solidesulfovibrio carbinoliphilus subsp. oakridgensis TaxID=694327 RepID=G7QE58_9BACT|nr:M57 family metalloprotease [Solidesulfovibrio carbinoliphilus]EHJ45952.1 peptidase M10A and M12B matrixin and adamalysin [Solidesulfovibrio carbinoliphilus subsp. oakridgensis]